MPVRATKPPAAIDYPRLIDAWLASGGRPGEDTPA
jgi:hypothetical protein